MDCLLPRAVIARRAILISAAFPVVAGASTVRIVSYNTQGDVTSPAPTTVPPYIATVLEGIGQQQYTGDNILKLPDIIALQETTSNSTTVAPIVSALNTYYNNPNLYGYSSYQATTSDGTTEGGGPNALIYNQTTMKLMASVGVGTPNSGTNGEFRQVVRYEFQPLVDAGTSNGVFYVYDCHPKSGGASTSADGTTDGALRNEEAQIIRNDEAANLPSSAAVLYVGDFNEGGSTEAAYQTMTTANSPGGVTQGAGIDPANPSDNYNLTWGSNTLSLLTEADDRLEYRDDLQLMTSNIYNDAANTLSYVSGSLHPFGNNGGTTYETNINTSSNTAINDINTVTRSNVLPAGSLTSTTVLAAMNNSLGSDHLPVVADYTIAGFNNGIWTGGTGNWNNFTFWTNEVVPNSSSIEVKIDSGNSTASVVTLNQNATIADLTLDANDTLNITSGFSLNLSGAVTSAFNGTFTNAGTLNAGAIASAGSFTTTGTFSATGNFNNSGTAAFGGTQNWSAGALFTNTNGTAMFSTDAGSASSLTLSVNASGGSVTFSSTEHLAALNIGSGALVTVGRNSAGGRSVVVTSAPSVSGKLDLSSNDLDASAASLATIISLIKTGYSTGANGPWTGNGITSSTAAANTTHLTALGVIQNNQSGSALFTASHPFDGVTPGTADILVRYTYVGDANLDGKIDASDYSLIDSGYLNHATTWFGGDFNYDGVVNGSDYTLIDNAFNTQSAVLTASIAGPDADITAEIAGTSADIGEPSRAVPEPATGAMTVVASLALLRRRKNNIHSFRQR
jgi:endonuclease/exonuclease/phosphatase family metal-dependent hydrolase